MNSIIKGFEMIHNKNNCFIVSCILNKSNCCAVSCFEAICCYFSFAVSLYIHLHVYSIENGNSYKIICRAEVLFYFLISCVWYNWRHCLSCHMFMQWPFIIDWNKSLNCIQESVCRKQETSDVQSGQYIMLLFLSNVQVDCRMKENLYIWYTVSTLGVRDTNW